MKMADRKEKRKKKKEERGSGRNWFQRRWDDNLFRSTFVLIKDINSWF